MVSPELLEASERLNKKRELYKKATRLGRYISIIGAIILLLALSYFTLLGVLGSILRLPSIGGMSIFVWFGGWIGGTVLGLLLLSVGDRITNQKELLAPFDTHEAAFLKVVDSMKYIETYQNEGIEQSKVEAIKKLSEVEKKIKEPRFEPYPFWEELTNEANENVRLLKQNFKERLLPSITQSAKYEDIMKAHYIVQKLAKYLLNPTILELKELNKSMLELEPNIKKATYKPLLGRYSYLRFPIFFVLCGVLFSYLSIRFWNIEYNTALLAGVGVFGALSTLYVGIAKR